jgi:hypothetical protein
MTSLKIRDTKKKLEDIKELLKSKIDEERKVQDSLRTKLTIMKFDRSSREDLLFRTKYKDKIDEFEVMFQKLLVLRQKIPD